MSYEGLKILIIGLGSMGKRRIRNLKANGVNFIAGVDLREDRREEVRNSYNIPVFKTLEEALRYSQYSAWIISVPPHIHHIYMQEALKNNTASFIEASVVDSDIIEIIAEAKKRNVFFAPSYTLFFHPAIKKIAQILENGLLGKVSNVLYHSGQYLPDWHSYEKVSDYYVARRETGGAREIVPFELTWMTMLFGIPDRVACFYKKTIDIEGGKDIDDTYNLLLEYKNFMINLCVDVVSRHATRRLLINGEQKQLIWDWDKNFIELYDPIKQEWENISYETEKAQSGYNKNITETMYNEEIAAFLGALTNNASFLNTLEKDHKVLQLLYTAEKSGDTNLIQQVL